MMILLCHGDMNTGNIFVICTCRVMFYVCGDMITTNVDVLRISHDMCCLCGDMITTVVVICVIFVVGVIVIANVEILYILHTLAKFSGCIFELPLCPHIDPQDVQLDLSLLDLPLCSFDLQRRDKQVLLSVVICETTCA
jgi:hypothetical protein